MSSISSRADWPRASPVGLDRDRDAVQLWLQIVGSNSTRLAPPINHCWNCTFYLTARGLTTSPMPYGGRSLTIDFDFIRHRRSSRPRRRAGGLSARGASVAAFYARLKQELGRLGVAVQIYEKPNELLTVVPFPQDRPAASVHDADAAHGSGAPCRRRIWLSQFRGRFLASAVRCICSGAQDGSRRHTFLGCMARRIRRYSHLPDRVTRDASFTRGQQLRFWSAWRWMITQPSTRTRIRSRRFCRGAGRPDGVSYSTDFGEFVLPHDEVRRSASPVDTVLDFLQSTYVAAADLAHWIAPHSSSAETGDRRESEPGLTPGESPVCPPTTRLRNSISRAKRSRPHRLGDDDRVVRAPSSTVIR